MATNSTHQSEYFFKLIFLIQSCDTTSVSIFLLFSLQFHILFFFRTSFLLLLPLALFSVCQLHDAHGLGRHETQQAMPPLSRGRRAVEAAEYDEDRNESESRSRSRSRSGLGADPLSRGIELALVRPLVFLLFVLLHALYALGILVVRAFRVVRALLSVAATTSDDAQPTDGEALALWRLARHRDAAAARTTKATKVGDGGGGGTKTGAMVPRHIGVSVEAPPAMRTRSLVARYALGLLLGREIVVGPPDRERESRRRDSFLKESVQVAIRCAAVVGTDEVSVFDKEGRLQEMARRGELDDEAIAIGDESNETEVRLRFCWPDYEKRASEVGNGHGHANGRAKQQERTVWVNVLGPQDSKEALASVATILGKQDKIKKEKAPLSVRAIDEILQGERPRSFLSSLSLEADVQGGHESAWIPKGAGPPHPPRRTPLRALPTQLPSVARPAVRNLLRRECQPLQAAERKII